MFLIGGGGAHVTFWHSNYITNIYIPPNIIRVGEEGVVGGKFLALLLPHPPSPPFSISFSHSFLFSTSVNFSVLLCVEKCDSEKENFNISQEKRENRKIALSWNFLNRKSISKYSVRIVIPFIDRVNFRKILAHHEGES